MRHLWASLCCSHGGFVKRAAKFVTVTTNFVWDMHSDVNNAGVEEGMQYMGTPFDHAVSTFLEDVEERG